MAFKSGTRIRPELGRMDFSGHANAAMITADALQNLASNVGNAILQHQQKKEERELNEQAANMVLQFSKSNPTAQDLGIRDLDTAKVAVKSLGGGENTLQIINRLNMANREQRQSEALSNAIAASTDTEGNLDKSDVVDSAIESGVSLNNIQRFLEIENMQEPISPDQLESINVGDFNVLLRNGKLAQAAKRQKSDGDDRPAGVVRIEHVQSKMDEARKAFDSGDSKKAFNILTAIGLKSPWTGGPLLQEEVRDIFTPFVSESEPPEGQPENLLIGYPNGSTIRNNVFETDPIEIKNKPKGRNRSKRPNNKSKESNSDIIDITSEDEIESLSSGQIFRLNGKTYKRK